MRHLIESLLSFSIVIAAIIGVIRFNRIYKAYQPFIFIVVAAFFAELATTIIVHSHHSNAIVLNVYTTLECILWFWQFNLWNAFSNKRKAYRLLAGLLIIVLAETITQGITSFYDHYFVIYSFCMVFLAIDQVNRLILEEKGNLLQNAKFLICTGIIVFYTYQALVESFFVLKIKQSDVFLSNIFSILTYVNLLANLLYAAATIWIPTRHKFTLLSSSLPPS